METIKAFEGFLDRMQGLLDEAKKQGQIIVRVEDLENAFPELKEFEDERTWLIKFIQEEVDCLSIDIRDSEDRVKLKNLQRSIAWLEKQGEKIDLANREYWRGYREGKQEILAKYADFEKQGEQKPADKVEPKFKVGDIIRHKKQGFTCKIIAVDNEYRLSDCNGTHLPFEWQDAYELVEQNPAWSEEDDKNLEKAIWYVEKGGKLIFAKTDKLVPWLKSLKDKVQPQPEQEWSEEDERNINEILYLVEANYLSSEEPHDRLINFLKSLRPQNTWKPSDEQMDALENAIMYGEVESIGILSLLYNDLKKLKG